MSSRSVNRVTLLGNIGRDAETSYTSSQVAVVKFSIATTRRWKDEKSGDWKEEVDWHNVVFWRGDKVAPYIIKGAKLYVEGRLQTRSYEKDGVKKYSTEVIAETVILLGGKGEGGDTGKNEGHREQPTPAGRPSQEFSGGIDEDDVPF